MLDPKILKKIKKCLALSQSPNPHEAAAALRQAEGLMRIHGVSHKDVAFSDLGEKNVKSQSYSRGKPSQWEVNLIAMVGRAFGCQMLFSEHFSHSATKVKKQGNYIFIGLTHQVEVATYTADVLIRRCKKARQTWISENLKPLTLSGMRGAKAKATRMGDVFATGWVHQISELVQTFVNPPEVDALIKERVESKSTGFAETKKTMGANKFMSNAEIAALKMGMDAARGESLNRPMRDASGKPKAIAF